MSLNILDVIQLGRQRVIDIDDDNFPIGLFFVEKSHDAEDFDLLDLTSVADELANFADVERVVISLCLGFRVNDVGIFPGLGARSVQFRQNVEVIAHFREGTVVPQVAFVGEAVANKSKLALFDVLLNWVEEFFFRDLWIPLALC